MEENIFKLNILLNNTEKYEKRKKDLAQQILSDFSSRHNIGIVVIDNEEIKLTLGQILINLFLLSFFEGQKVKITKDFLFTSESISGPAIEKYFNKLLTYIKDDGNDFDFYRSRIYDILNEMSDFSTNTNVLAGNTLDYLDFLEIKEKYPEYNALVNVEIPYGLQYNEIEDLFNKKSKELMDFFATHKDTNLSPFVRSETGINAKQLGQCLSFVGLKPDIDGSVIPVVIKNNMMRGLQTIEEFYINAKGTRLALCTNYKQVRKSGLKIAYSKR